MLVLMHCLECFGYDSLMSWSEPVREVALERKRKEIEKAQNLLAAPSK